MEILILSKRQTAAARIRLGRLGLLMSAVVVTTTLGAIAWFGYERGAEDMMQTMLNDSEHSKEAWQREIVLQRGFLDNLNRDLEADLSALAGSVGQMRGEVSRLDAVAESVVAFAGIDATEFALGSPPPLGGPAPARTESPRWDELFANISALQSEISLREDRLDLLETFVMARRSLAETELSGRPIEGGWISSGYGYRTDPVSGRREFHGGIDFAGRSGEKILAVAPGVVTWSGKRWGYGNLVEVSHGQGYVTRYAHNRENLVSVGEKVEKGQAIALLGASGRATGPHVHFEVVRADRSLNPYRFIKRGKQP